MINWKAEDSLIEFWVEGNQYHLDVRPLLEKGGEPYPQIMEGVQQLSGDDVLVIHALFEPKPLLGVITGMGLDAKCERVEVEHWTMSISRPG